MINRRALVWIAAALLYAPSAHALTQPNGAPIPTQPGCDGGQPTGLAAAFSCVCKQPNVCNIGAGCPSQNSCDDGMNGECETTMWHSFNDNTCIPSNISGLDVYGEAATLPETFHPTCPQTFSLITRGTAMFQDAFGWYNVTGSKPANSDLHIMLDCNAQPGTDVVLDLQNEPAYLGGDVGFFVVTPESHASPSTCAGGDCCASVARLADGEGHVYYSERAYNPDFSGADSLIHLLTYQSHVWDNQFYFAWEDIFGASNNDFTDLVTGVSGIHCAGGGQPCDAGGQGLCGRGITLCSQGVLACEQLYDSGPEECNGVDDDCNGSVDDSAVCPDEGDVCHQGACVESCSTSEFPCPPDEACDSSTGLCVAAGCEGVTCSDGEVCFAGNCVAPCEEVVCPHGQQCVANECIDLCAGVSCSGGDVCVKGKCLPGCAQCNGITCRLPLSCDTGLGACLDASCPEDCADGTYCENGECKDACDGAICPGGQPCVNGVCGGTAGSGGGPGVNPEGGNGSTGQGGAGGANAGQGDNGEAGASCLCSAGNARTSAPAIALSLLLGGLFATRRRRRA